MRLPPAATICAASCGISATGLSIRATMASFVACSSASSSAVKRASASVVGSVVKGVALSKISALTYPSKLR